MFNRDFIISFNDAEQNNKMHIENWRVVSIKSCFEGFYETI